MAHQTGVLYQEQIFLDGWQDSMERKVELAQQEIVRARQASDTIESIKKGTMKKEVASCLDSEEMSPLDFLKEYSMKRFVQMIRILCNQRNSMA